VSRQPARCDASPMTNALRRFRRALTGGDLPQHTTYPRVDTAPTAGSRAAESGRVIRYPLA
jgi:hypothetical protein